jgi:hypothetical protein
MLWIPKKCSLPASFAQSVLGLRNTACSTLGSWWFVASTCPLSYRFFLPFLSIFQSSSTSSILLFPSSYQLLCLLYFFPFSYIFLLDFFSFTFSSFSYFLLHLVIFIFSTFPHPPNFISSFLSIHLKTPVYVSSAAESLES